MVKRTLDLLVAVPSLILLSPLMLSVAVLIKLTSPGPVLFRQQRIGWRGRPFQILKFRTMVANADDRGPLLTVWHDPRITPVGRHLRQLKLDELPQLINVLRGEMSLVGPRPQIPSIVRHYPPDVRTIVFSVRPGITDPATITYRNEERLLAVVDDPQRCHVDQILPDKLDKYVRYVRGRSTVRDLRILLQTLGCLLPGGESGASPDGSDHQNAAPYRVYQGRLVQHRSRRYCQSES